jgi:hypothetical protein
MIAQRRFKIVLITRRKITAMKKLMTLMLGLAFLTTTVAVTFAQDTKSDSTMKKGKKGGKKGTKKGDDTSKSSR